ncbi:MAG: A/G-specific adenine glycosylase [Gammaproteobacteria bacterium]
MNSFARKLLAWYRVHGRHDLPWQQPDPYRIWVSEIMLQQTQVRTVIPYFERFIERFPDVQSLAGADLDEVLHLWSGLGYYARARNLYKAAEIISNDLQGVFPREIEALMKLPGIGRSTAGAILALSQGQRHPILDGNVKRVLTRYYGISGWPGESKVEAGLWSIAERETPQEDVAAYTQAIMDLGATVCTRSRTRCDQCPVAVECYARREGLQTAFPARKQKKTLPVRSAVFTILENAEGEVLLEKRPPAGIWGGLWSLPECPVDEEIPAWIKRQFGSTVSGLTQQTPLRHTFSHFHLDIHPYRAKLEGTDLAVGDREQICWYKPGPGIRLGLAAPVKKLLESIQNHPAGAD